MGARNLQLSRIGIVDLLDTRLEHLRRLRTADEHIATFSALRAELEAVPDDEGVGPIAGLVNQHVDFSAALAAALEVHRRDPLTEPAQREAAERIFQATVVDQLGPQRSARERVQVTERAQRLRESLAEDLARFPAPPGGRAIADLLDAWIAGGAEIAAALSARTKVVEAGRAAGPLVRDADRAVARLRRAIRLEKELYDDLPGNLEALILGFIDTLGQTRRRGGRVEASDVALSPDAEPIAEAPFEGVDEAAAPLPQPDAPPVALPA